jgi:hypothetical protein
MSKGAKIAIAVVVIGGLLYWYYVSSTPTAAANVPNGSGSSDLPGSDNTTSAGGPASGSVNPTAPGGGSGTVGTLLGITPPTPAVTNASAKPDVNTYVTNLLKRVPGLAGSNALTVNPTTGYVSAAATGPGTVAASLRRNTGSGAAGTSSTGYHAAPTPAFANDVNKTMADLNSKV